MSTAIRVILFLLLLTTLQSATIAEDDPIEQKLSLAKLKYDDDINKARSTILDALKNKARIAKDAGDLEKLETAQAEIKDFEASGVIPRSLPIKSYETQRKLARVKIEKSYNNAITQYTKDGQVELAKAIRQERDEFLDPTGFKQFEGNWTVKFRGGSVHTYKISGQGEVKCVEENYKNDSNLYRRNEDVLMVYKKDKLERHSIFRGKLIVEHWHPAADYAAGRPPGDVGESVETK